MNDPQRLPGTLVVRVPRAEIILTAAIALVCLLIVGLAMSLSNGRKLHAETQAIVANVRSARDDLIALAQTRSDLEFVFHAYLQDRSDDRLRRFRLREHEVEQNLVNLRRRTAPDPEVDAIAGRMQALVDQEVQRFSARIERGTSDPAAARAAAEGVRGSLGDETAQLHALLNARIDAARAAEQSERARLDAIAIALAVLSVFASALAIIALRRERAQWALANKLAEDARAAATASDLAKTRFLAAASHDMRQPLHALTLYLSALGRRIEGDEARRILANAERAAQSMSTMFSTLLDLARVQADVIKPDITTFPLQTLLDRVVSEHPGANVIAEPTPIEIRSDPALLERILRNLVSNALKHGGGSARLRVRTRDMNADIEVSDSGPGIAQEDQARVFEEFVRLDGGANSEGLGLGLAIVQRLAKLLGHPLELRSSPGEGATFIVRAPIVRGVAKPKQDARAATVSLEGVRVLLMDDDALALEAMAGSLRDLGAVVRTCASESEVADAIEHGYEPRLLVMDLRINGALSGIEIANRTRALLDPPPSVLIVTGDTGADTLSALRASHHRWLIKPVDPSELAQAAAEAV